MHRIPRRETCAYILSIFAVLCVPSSRLLSAENFQSIKLNDLQQLKSTCSSIGAPLILVNVWAVNCSHCIDELTLLAKLGSNSFKNSNELRFLGICLTDRTLKDFDVRYAAILDRKKTPYPVAQWSGELELLKKHLGMEATPFTALLDSDGKVIEVLELPRTEAKAEEMIRDALKRATAAKK